MGGNAQASRLRQRISQEARGLIYLAELAQERSEMLPGSLYERRRRCGKRGCRCVRGKLHKGTALAIRSGGRGRWVSLTGLEVEKVAGLTESYRRFRHTRAELVRAFGKLLRTFDELGRLRQVDIGGLHRTFLDA